MRLAKFSRTLLPLALPVVLATCAFAQEHPNISPNSVRNQLARPATAAPAQAAPKPSAEPARNTAKKSPAKAASARSSAEKPAEKKANMSRRDPFDPLLTKAQASNAPPENLPPGKAGLVVGSLHIDGIVSGSGGMIAIVSNPQRRVYFLREGDKLYDGSVDHITLEAVSFHEVGKDAFGKPLERQVTKRLYPSPGEQQ
jgi:hypothetical protein